ncbi:MAG: sulfur carrier protein ThiS [Candidatus Hydrogenedentes bacterium]|nr:sulfur carrier protein ThiS [Candidatus Hydrogenedentota bacterium]MBI3118747.1 sulfur carrier protein ThiS [Candidatus Hydrogenedentota bacterium]
MKILLNGEQKDVAADATLLSLVEQLGLNPKTVVAQRNDEIVERAEFAATHLQDGDRLELVRFVGGG